MTPMAEATHITTGIREAIRALWRRVGPNPDNDRAYALVLMFVGGILLAVLVASLVENTLLDPNVSISGGTISPDRKWVALTEQIEPGPVMGNFDTAIELRHHDGLLVGPTLERTFLMKFDSSKVELRRMKWYTDTVLEVVLRAAPGAVPKHLTQVDDVIIDYRRLDPE